MLDFRMYTFLSVCRHMNYTRAASELHLSQPAVTYHIRYLEEYYGTKLFIYTKHQLKLTRSGLLLRNMATNVYHDTNLLKRRIKNRKQKISFGATLTIAEYDICDRLTEFLKRHTGVTVSIILGTTDELLANLEEGKIDFAMIEGTVDSPSYESVPFARERLVACCGADYDIGSPINLLDLTDHRLLLCAKETPARRLLENAFQEHNVFLDDLFFHVDLGTPDLVKKLALRNIGVAFLYESAVRDDIERGILREIDIHGLVCVNTFSFICPVKGVDRDVFKRLCSELCTVVPDGFDKACIE